MPALARFGDLVDGGAHCHGHSHGPSPTPGRIIRAATKVFADGRPVARTGDEGYSPVCCGHIGRITIQQSQSVVFVEGRPAATVGTPTLHCDMAPGAIKTGSSKVFVS